MILLEIYFSFFCENPLRIDKVIATSLVYYFFGRQCSTWNDLQRLLKIIINVIIR